MTLAPPASLRRTRSAVGAAAALLGAGMPSAADTERGQQLCHQIRSKCHSPGGNPGPGSSRPGANDPSAIQLALDRVLEMEPFPDCARTGRAFNMDTATA